jgi:hypothetical protein
MVASDGTLLDIEVTLNYRPLSSLEDDVHEVPTLTSNTMLLVGSSDQRLHQS